MDDGSGHSIDTLLAELYRRALAAEGPGRLGLRSWVERAEAWRIAHALREARGNRSAAARALGIGRRTLYSKMEKLGVGAVWGVWTPSLRRNNGFGTRRRDA
jgi:DNA-binding NtrC family response regulator